MGNYMKQILQTIFRHKIADRKWYHIIAWWELRRLVFNCVLLFCGLISLILFLFVFKFGGDLIHPFTPIAFGLVVNFFYTFGWLTELVVRQISEQKSNNWGIKSFKIGLALGGFLTFLPTIFFGLFGFTNGENFSSPYSHFTKDKPDFTHLVGEYNFDTEKSKLSILESDKTKGTKIVLNSDSTFSMTNIPVFGFENSQKYELWNGKGSWYLETDDDKWKVSVHCDTLFTGDNKSTFEDGFFTNDFNIYNDKPPYKLYQIIGDPDEWTGALYEKQK